MLLRKRHHEIKRLLRRFSPQLLEKGKYGYVKMLDIGSGIAKIDALFESVDIQPEKKPDICASVLNMPIPSGQYRLVTMLEVIEHFTSKEMFTVFHEVRRVMAKNGILAVSMPYSDGIWLHLQKVTWYVREHTTEREYHRNEKSCGHVGLVTKKTVIEIAELCGFELMYSGRLMKYDSVFVFMAR